jgi:hypothetical protein
MRFEHWLGSLLGQRPSEIERLISDETALQFLIAWSLFESKCFDGDLKTVKLKPYSERLASEQFVNPAVATIAAAFHSRYQDPTRLKNLMHRQTSTAFERALAAPFETLLPADRLLVVCVVACRYRNNMFHGNKGVSSWLAFRPQIRQCIDALQALVAHEESRRPTMVIKAEVA